MKKRKSEKSLAAPLEGTGYDAVLCGLVALLESAQLLRAGQTAAS